MSYSKTNIRDVEDAAAKHGVGAHQEARFPLRVVGAEQSGMNHMRVKPGMREPFAHSHKQAEEICVVLSGSGRVKLNDDIVELEPLDVVRIGAGVARMLEADDTGLEVIIFGPTFQGDAELIQEGFWS